MSSKYPTLKFLTTHKAVTTVKTLLKKYGFYKSFVTGIPVFSLALRSAVKKFQKFIGARDDGIVGPKTWGALLSRQAAGKSLKNGSSGTEVRYLQEALNATISASLKEDGQFGPKTFTAVKAYQQSRGLGADGIVGSKTWAALKGAR